MQQDTVDIVLIDYPNAMQSAVVGLRELFTLATDIPRPDGAHTQFRIQTLTPSQLPAVNGQPQIILLPPSLGGDFYLAPTDPLLAWLRHRHRTGTVLCSACAGTFILAATGLLAARPATTHWQLTAQFAGLYPDVALDADHILINDGDLITAGGLMSWVDLGLELVAQFSHPAVMRQLGKLLIVDTGPRQQRYYQVFSPRLDHGDAAILKCQHHLQSHYGDPTGIRDLADYCFLSERTFLRRFVGATGLKPTAYLQKLRIHKACEQLESGSDSIEQIALAVGYEDTSAFRKLFVRQLGLTPREFRARFARTG